MNTVAKDLAVVFCLLALLGIGTATAQEVAADPAAEDEPAAVEEEEEWAGTRISFHGYLSQAYAATDGNTLLGISKEGTADYRTAAIQLRADVTPRDTFAIQFSHERLGVSQTQIFQDDVALDWLFYEHRFGNSSVKVGRVQIPFGIYNEVRDVGTLLPFYRPSSNFYGEGSYTSETVDGVVLSHTFGKGEWQLDADLHYGNWQFINRSGRYAIRKVHDSIGAELWLQTPVSGLRIGTGGMRYEAGEPGAEGGGPTESWYTYHLSLQGKWGPVDAQAEYKLIDFGHGDYNAGYAHLGVEVTDKITVNGQVDFSNLNVDFFREGDFDDDTALGVNYAFRPDLVLKLEHHWNEGYIPEVPAQNFFAPKPETRYWLVSLSTSF